MSNMELLRDRVRLLVKDVSYENSDIENVINHIIQDIASHTKLFKKLYGFTVHKDIEQYDFRHIARMNEEVEQEPTKITITDPDIKDVIEYLESGEFADPIVEKTLEDEIAKSLVIDILDIFDKVGNSVIHRFDEHGTVTYYCYDEEWRDINDKEPFVFSAWVVPHIDELTPEILFDLMPALIAGTKFFINDFLHSPSDTQATNYDFMRYHQAKEELLNKYPVTAYARNVQRIDQWL